MWEIFGTQNSPFVTIHAITTQRRTSLLFTWCNAWSPKNLGTRYRLPLVFTDNRYHHELSILQLLTLTKIAYVTYLSRVANNNFPERFCCGKKAFLKQKKKFFERILSLMSDSYESKGDFTQDSLEILFDKQSDVLLDWPRRVRKVRTITFLVECDEGPLECSREHPCTQDVSCRVAWFILKIFLRHPRSVSYLKWDRGRVCVDE